MEVVKPFQSTWKIVKHKDKNHELKKFELYLDDVLIGFSEDPEICKEVTNELKKYAQIVEKL